MKTIVSGIQPTGNLTLGNYLGAIKQFVDLQNTLDDAVFYIFIADLHAITVPKVPAELRKNIKELAALYLAAGLNPEKVNLFIQSEVREHAELGYALQTITYIGELERMTQFKDKKVKQVNGVSTALLTYPVLMAADILLYQTELVPIGADQKQHLELARDLAIRFNNLYGDVFKVPEAYIGKSAARVMSLADPTKKMSKSDANLNAFISMDDDKDTIIRKFKRAFTDSDNKIIVSPDKPGITNLLTIYCAFTDKTFEQAQMEFEGKGYGDFKIAVGEAVAEVVDPIRLEKNKLLANKDYLDNVLKQGAEFAERLAYRTLGKVYKKIGLVPRKRS